ncbi:ATP-dependent DNA ligase [Mycolicibacter minnesotensis]
MGATPRTTRVTLTNADKVLYPATGTTKAEVFDYYTRIAEVMLPHIAGRPATRKRWPNGVAQGSFFEKQLASSAPGWLARADVRHRTGITTYPIIEDLDGLAWIAQQAALEVHVPQWRFEGEEGERSGAGERDRRGAKVLKPGKATRLVFDLDPGEGVTMSQLAEVARAVRELTAELGLETFPVTSGSKGLHLYAALEPAVGSGGAVVVAKRIAQELQTALPNLVTATMAKKVRAGKVFLDWSQNNAAKTTIAPYSLRGRDHPTVAAPRTWAELDDPELRQLRYDEVLDRVARDGDLLAGLDPGPPRDRLAPYRSKRDAGRTPEPVPVAPPAPGGGDSFVIHEHHARRLHYDFRLERDGVLVSWAVPKNLPETTSVNHLAVRTEDHPLEYGSFEGTIPKGEYGAGTVRIWDAGSYVTEKFEDSADKGEVIVVLAGSRITGRYALIRTGGNQWLAHRMKDQQAFAFADLAPMLATEGPVTALDPGQWAFEGKWDGYRLLAQADHGRVRLRARSGRDVTDQYPQVSSSLSVAELAEHHLVLDGELVALDDAGVPSFAAMQDISRSTRLEFWAFDLLYLDDRPLLRVPYRDRRRLLETLARGTDLVVKDLLAPDGQGASDQSRRLGWEGVVAKRWDAPYLPGRRSSTWVKAKHWRTQEIVIGGWRAGEGARGGGIGALLMGIPDAGGLRYVGRVGTGFTDRALAALTKTLLPLRSDESPFQAPLPRTDAQGATFVEPRLVGEVRFSEWTPDGRMRQSSWRGLRPDKEPEDVRSEQP